MKKFILSAAVFLSTSVLVYAQNNTITGYNSGAAITTGYSNNIFGAYVGTALTTGANNTLIGTINQGNAQYTGRYLTSGSNNIFIGPAAGAGITTTSNNIAIGTNNLVGNSGNNNTSVGISAGYTGHGGNGSNNAFFGHQTGYINSTGSNNAFFGNNAGMINTTGSNLTFIGSNAGYTGSIDALTNATAIGYNAQVTASNSLILGNAVNVGIGTTAPTHGLTLGNVGSSMGIAQYNTAITAANYERMVEQFQSNSFTIGSYYGTGGNARSIQIGVQSSPAITTLSGGRIFSINNGASAAVGNFNFSAGTSTLGSIATFNTNLAATAGQQNMVAIQGSVTQSGTSGYTALLVAPYDATSTGSGNKYLIDAGINTAASGGGTHTSHLLLTNNGNMGLGTVDNANWKLATSPYKLAVGGSVIATAVTVKLATNWPDYVFDKQYQLPSLTDLRKYIEANHHLPDMPTAEEVNLNGLDLGEVNKLLLKKVEELTLYVLQHDEQKKVYESQILSQGKRLQVLEEQLNLLLKKQATVAKDE